MKKKKDKIWTLPEQEIVWHDMQNGIPPQVIKAAFFPF